MKHNFHLLLEHWCSCTLVMGMQNCTDILENRLASEIKPKITYDPTITLLSFAQEQ